MITKLTKKQKAKLVAYRDKWLNIGLSTEQASLERTKEIISNVYTHLLNKTNVPVVILDNPFDTWVAVCIHSVKNNQVWGQVRNQVMDQVRNQVMNQVVDQVRNQVKGLKLVDFIYPYLDGNLMSGYFSLYDFLLNELNVKIKGKVKDMFEIYKSTSELSLIYPFDDICFVSAKPIEIHFNENKILHNSNGPSIKYKGKFELYHLNGIKVSKEIVKIKPEKITVNRILQEQNVEIRRELLRKLGIDNFIIKLRVKPVDASEDYELYKIKLGSDLNGTYLKMRNPSLKDTYHFEGVPNKCNTVVEALAWRDAEEEYIKPIKLT